MFSCMFSCVCDIDADNSVVYNASERTARKHHLCGECHRLIEPGERYEYVFEIYDGDPQSHKTCMTCGQMGRELLGCILHGRVWQDIHEHYCADDDCICELPARRDRMRVARTLRQRSIGEEE